MWLGLAVPFVLHGVNALSHYYEFIGRINFAYSMPLAHDAVRFYLRFDCMWMGLAYLVNANITFSLWFFYLLVKAEEVLFTRIGILSTENLDIFSHTFEGPTMGLLSHQTMGAMIVMVLLGLWTARVHMWRVCAAPLAAGGAVRWRGTDVVSHGHPRRCGGSCGHVVVAVALWSAAVGGLRLFVRGVCHLFSPDADDCRGRFGRGCPGHVGLWLSHIQRRLLVPWEWPGCWPRA